MTTKKPLTVPVLEDESASADENKVVEQRANGSRDVNVWTETGMNDVWQGILTISCQRNITQRTMWHGTPDFNTIRVMMTEVLAGGSRGSMNCYCWHEGSIGIRPWQSNRQRIAELVRTEPPCMNQPEWFTVLLTVLYLCCVSVSVFDITSCVSSPLPWMRLSWCSELWK